MNRRNSVIVPAAQEMATEPAQTIGDLFADRVMVKTIVSAGVGVVAIVFRISTDDELIESVATLVTMSSLFIAAGFAQWEARKRAREQARATRAAVYAPATVAKIEHLAQAGGANVKG